jgi:hypothetical protein
MTLLVAGSLSNLLFVISGPGGYNRYLASYQRLRTDEDRVAPWIQRINRVVPEGKQVLSVGDAQVFDMEVPVLYNTVFDEDIFTAMVKDHSPGEVHRALAEKDISQVYVNWAELRRYRSPGNYDDGHGFTEFVQPAVLERFPSKGGSPHAEVYPVKAIEVR